MILELDGIKNLIYSRLIATDHRMKNPQRQPSSQVPAIALAVSLFALLSCGGAESGKSDRSSVTIGAMRPGTSWYVFAATLANLLQKDLPEGTNAEVIARGGAIGNPILVDRGDATIALAQAATAVWAANGDARAYKKKHENIRALVGGLNSVWVTALLREEYIARTGNDTLEKALTDGQPIRVVMKPAGSVVPVFADMVLEAFGTSREKIVSGGGDVTQVSANQIASILRDGRADLYFETAIRGHPTVTEITTTVDVRFVDLPDSVLDRLKGPGVNPIPLPAYFKGQSGPTKAVDMGTVLICHKDLPDELAYLVTKTVCENKEEMGRAHKAWLDFVPEQGGLPEKTGIPLHPGAERYFMEKGWL